MILRRMGTLDKAVEGLSGMAIAATNRDKRQLETLQAIEARLADLERKEKAPPPL